MPEINLIKPSSGPLSVKIQIVSPSTHSVTWPDVNTRSIDPTTKISVNSQSPKLEELLSPSELIEDEVDSENC
jgi:hypothetical protein